MKYGFEPSRHISQSIGAVIRLGFSVSIFLALYNVVDATVENLEGRQSGSNGTSGSVHTPDVVQLDSELRKRFLTMIQSLAWLCLPFIKASQWSMIHGVSNTRMVPN